MIVNGQDLSQRQLLQSAQCIGRLTLTKHYNHWVANGVPHPDWDNDWLTKGVNCLMAPGQVPVLNPSYHFFGSDGEWHDGYKWDAVPEDPNDRPPDIGTNPAPSYPWGQNETKQYAVTTETFLGWEYLQDLAELWSGINLSTNATFPQITSWPVNPKDHPYPSSYKGDDIGITFTDLNIKNPVAPLAKFNATVGNSLIDRRTNKQSSRSRIEFGPTRVGTGSNAGGYFFESHFNASVSFGYSETKWTGLVRNYWEKSTGREYQAVFPFCHSVVNESHWFRQKYRENNTFVFFASMPQNTFDSFVLKDQGSSLFPPSPINEFGMGYIDDGTLPFSVFSIPEFLSYEVSGTRRLHKDAQALKEIKKNDKISFNAVFLYADNNGTPVLIAATKVDPPVISEGKGKSIFYSQYFSTGKAVSNINIVEI